MNEPCGFTLRRFSKCVLIFKSLWDTGFKVWRKVFRKVKRRLPPPIDTVILITRGGLREGSVGKDMTWRFSQERALAFYHFRNSWKEIEDRIKRSMICNIAVGRKENQGAVPFLS